MRVWLLAPRFRTESLAAARAAGGIALATYHCVRNGAGSDALVEAVSEAAETEAPAAGGRTPGRPSSGPAWSTPSSVSPPRNAASSTDSPLGAPHGDEFCLPSDIF